MDAEAAICGRECRLVLRASAYEHPEARDFDDANWLVGEVDLVAGGSNSFAAARKVTLRTDDLQRFRDELVLVVESLSGSARLDHLEAEVGCTITLNKGTGNLGAFVREHRGPELTVREAETDQSYATQTLRELDSFLERFPVRGARPTNHG